MRLRTVRVLPVAGATLAAAFGAQAVFAATVTLNDVTPPNAPITVSLKKGTKFKASASVSGIPVTVSCSAVSFTFTTPAAGDGPVAATNPSFAACKDNFGGTDAVTTNSADGPWTFTFIPKTTKHPNEVSLGLPQSAGTFTSTLVSGCTGEITPNGPFTAIGKYNDINTATFTGVKLPIGAAGCKVPATATMSATFVLSTNVKYAP